MTQAEEANLLPDSLPEGEIRHCWEYEGYVPMWVDVVDSAGKRFRVDVGRFIETRFMVVTDAGEVVPFVMNHAQRKFFRMIAEDWNAGKSVRFIVLKARQLGISTLVEAILTALGALQRNKQAILVSKDPDSATDVFRMSKGFVDHFRDRAHPIRLKRNAAKALQFAATRSEMQIVSVQKGVRGGTKQYAHLSEYAFWPNPEEVMTALVPSLHPKPQTIVIIESTANGFNDFMEKWNLAEAGDGTFRPFFLPWTDHPDYRLPYDGHALDPEERKLLALGVDRDQLQWRRKMIEDLGPAKFAQEYPRTPTEAFQSTGTGIFDRARLAKVMERTATLAKTCERGRFEYDETYLPKGRGRFVVSNVRWVPDPKGPVRIYQRPIPGAKYALGGDTADGGIDFWTADVNLAPHGIEVATFGQEGLTAHQYACQMVCLGRFYNNALVGIEVNRNRAAMQDIVLCGYPNVYVSHEEETIDQDPLNRIGFTTTTATKFTIVTDMQTHFDLHPEYVNDHLTAGEMATFVSRPSASGTTTTWGASSKRYHDDRVMSRAISLHVMQDVRCPEAAEPERPKTRMEETIEWMEREMEGGTKSAVRRQKWF